MANHRTVLEVLCCLTSARQTSITWFRKIQLCSMQKISIYTHRNDLLICDDEAAFAHFISFRNSSFDIHSNKLAIIFTRHRLRCSTVSNHHQTQKFIWCYISHILLGQFCIWHVLYSAATKICLLRVDRVQCKALRMLLGRYVSILLRLFWCPNLLKKLCLK